MDIVQTLTPAELEVLRGIFQAAPQCALPFEEFNHALHKCLELRSVDQRPSLTRERLHAIFDEIDFNGDLTVSWEEFSMYLINEAISQSRSVAEIDKIHDYKLSGNLMTDVPDTLKMIKFIPEERKVVQVYRTGRATKIRVSGWNDGEDCFHEETHLDSKRMTNARLLALEYVPPLDAIVVASSDVHMSTYEIRDRKKRNDNKDAGGHGKGDSKKGAATAQQTVATLLNRKPADGDDGHAALPRLKHIALEESQTVLTWNRKYHRMMSGSRTGVVSAWAVDHAMQVEDSDRLHELAVTDIVCFEEQILTCSLDNTIKMTDIVKEVVATTLTGHTKGVSHMALWTEQAMLFSSGLECEPLAWALKMPSKRPIALVDKLRPHRGAIIGLFQVPNTYQLTSVDNKGSMKIWDMRTYACVSTTTLNTKMGSSPITCFTYNPSRRGFLVGGRGIFVVNYQDTQRPLDADDTHCTLLAFNESAKTVISIHKARVKSWEAASGRVSGTIDQVSENMYDITCICADTRGRRLFVGTAVGTISIVNANSGDILQELDAGDQTGMEVLSLEYVKLKCRGDQPMVIVTSRSGVYLLPDTDEPRCFPIRCIQTTFGDTHETQSAFLFNPSNLLAVVADIGCVLAVDTDTYSVIAKIDTNNTTDYVSHAISLFPQPYVFLAYNTGSFGVVRVKPRDGVYPPPIVFEHIVPGASVTSMVYDVPSEIVIVGDDRGNVVTYDIYAIVRHQSGPSPSPKVVKQWSVGKQGVVSLLRYRWKDDAIEACGVLVANGAGGVSLYGLLGHPLGPLAQSRGLETPGIRIPPFCTEADKVIAGDQLRDYIKTHRGVRTNTTTIPTLPIPTASGSLGTILGQTLTSYFKLPPENDNLVSSHTVAFAEPNTSPTDETTQFFMTELGLGPELQQANSVFRSLPPIAPGLPPAHVSKDGRGAKHLAKEHPTALRTMAVSQATIIGLTPRPPPEKIPAIDQRSNCSFPSDAVPQPNVRTAYKPAQPPRPNPTISQAAIRYFKELGVHHENGVSQARRTLRDKGSVVLGESASTSVMEDPSPRQLFPPPN
eukprot:PhF_6_TR25483/c0_g1_i1/m.35423